MNFILKVMFSRAFAKEIALLVFLGLLLCRQKTKCAICAFWLFFLMFYCAKLML
jgi:hypothetical protein